MKPYVPQHTSATYTRGQIPAAVRAGDTLLVRHHGFVASAIRAACRLRKPRGLPWRQWWGFCRVNHACTALTDGASAVVAQATAKGVVVSTLSSMDWYALGVVHVECTPAQLAAKLRFALRSVGCGYGFAQIPADLVNAATGLELSLGWGDRMVCSTEACRAEERTDFIPDRSPDCVTPPHLACYFGVVVEAV